MYDSSDCIVNGGGVALVDPQLGPLQNNGGPTQTNALLPGSLAINVGNLGGCRDAFGALILVDQRGFARVGRCDIGAYEFPLRTFLPLIVR